MRTLPELARAAAALLAVAVLAGCSTSSTPAAGSSAAAPAAGSSAPAATTAAVAQPATISLYTSEPEAKIQQIIDAFNELHPQITVEVFRAGTGDLTARIESEKAAGGIQADVLLAADAGTFEGYAAEDLLLGYTPSDIVSIDPEVVDPEGFYTGTRIIPTVIAYNTTLVTEPPASWAALTDAEWAGTIALPNPDVSGAAAYNAAVWYQDAALGEAWLERLAANEPVVLDSNGPVSQAVAAGSQPIGVVVDYLVRDLAAQGSPVAVSYPSEGVPYISQPVGIFANTDEEAASKLFVDFLLSAEGQAIAVEQNYLPVRGDVGTPEGAPALDELATLAPDLESVRAIQPEAVERFNALFS